MLPIHCWNDSEAIEMNVAPNFLPSDFILATLIHFSDQLAKWNEFSMKSVSFDANLNKFFKILWFHQCLSLNSQRQAYSIFIIKVKASNDISNGPTRLLLFPHLSVIWGIDFINNEYRPSNENKNLSTDLHHTGPNTQRDQIIKLVASCGIVLINLTLCLFPISSKFCGFCGWGDEIWLVDFDPSHNNYPHRAFIQSWLLNEIRWGNFFQTQNLRDWKDIF